MVVQAKAQVVMLGHDYVIAAKWGNPGAIHRQSRGVGQVLCLNLFQALSLVLPYLFMFALA